MNSQNSSMQQVSLNQSHEMDCHKVEQKIEKHELVHQNREKSLKDQYQRQIEQLTNQISTERAFFKDSIGIIRTVLEMPINSKQELPYVETFLANVKQLFDHYQKILDQESLDSLMAILEGFPESLKILENQFKEICDELKTKENEINRFQNQLKRDICSSSPDRYIENQAQNDQSKDSQNDSYYEMAESENNKDDLFSKTDNKSLQDRIENLQGPNSQKKIIDAKKVQLTEDLKNLHDQISANQKSTEISFLSSNLSALRTALNEFMKVESPFGESENQKNLELDHSKFEEDEQNLPTMKHFESIVGYLEQFCDKLNSVNLEHPRSSNNMEESEIVNWLKEHFKKDFHFSANKESNNGISLKDAFKKDRKSSNLKSVEELFLFDDAKPLLELFCEKIGVDFDVLSDKRESKDPVSESLKRQIISVFDFNKDFKSNFSIVHEIWYHGMFSCSKIISLLVHLNLQILSKLVIWDHSFNPQIEKLKAFHLKVVDNFKEKTYKIRQFNEKHVFFSEVERKSHIEFLKKDFVNLEATVQENSEKFQEIF